MPPPTKDRAAKDIAFAASTVMEGERTGHYRPPEDRILRKGLIKH